MLVETIEQAVKEMNSELDRLHVTNSLSREICVLIVKTAYQMGRLEGMQEAYNDAQKVIGGPEPVPTPQPEEPAPEPAPPEPQGKVICTDCGSEQDSHQKEYDLDCRCGGSFVKVL